MVTWLQTSMARNSVWAKIICTASSLGADIYIYSQNGMGLLRYPSSFSLSDLTEHVIYLQNASGDHFDVLSV